MKEKCAVFGVWSKNQDVARLSYYGLVALQHRGQESSGIVSTDGEVFYSRIGSGLVSQVFSDSDLDKLVGQAAIGHNRYSTSGKKDGHHMQPVLRSDDNLALAHNGNLPVTDALEKFLRDKRVYKPRSNDSEMMADAIRYHRYSGLSMVESIKQVWPLMQGAYSCVVLGHSTLHAFRDEHGIRPLVLGKLLDGFVVASETCALDVIGAEFVREVRPGELISIDRRGVRSTQVRKPREKLDVFEYIYFARPDSVLQGQYVSDVRHKLGRQLAADTPTKADIVIPVPDSGVQTALGFAQASGIDFDIGLIKNRYIHRTFITPTQQMRERKIKMKLNPLPGSIKNKSVVLVDDSIVRGTTSKQIIAMVRAAGAKEVHLRISSPPVLYPDYYGIDTPEQTELIAAKHTLDEVCRLIGADSLGYLSVAGLKKAMGSKYAKLCTACFTGEYPISIGEANYKKLGLATQAISI